MINDEKYPLLTAENSTFAIDLHIVHVTSQKIEHDEYICGCGENNCSGCGYEL